MGFCDDTGVYLADDQASGDVPSKACLKTALEECLHWVTKAGDNSRDLQNFAFCLIVEILASRLDFPRFVVCFITKEHYP